MSSDVERPGGPDDGEPLSTEKGGEADRFAALIYAYKAVTISEPVYSERGNE